MEPYLPTLSPLSRATFTLATLTSVYLIRRTNSDPNPPPPTTNSPVNPSLKKPDFLMTAGNELTMRRHLSFVTSVGLYHALLASLPPSERPTLCPAYNTPTVNAALFTWTRSTATILLTLFAAGILRISAYTNLGPSFTFHITKPAGLKTTGVHRYIRHPSYTAVFGVAISMVLLLFRAEGVIGCWVSAPLAQVLEQAMVAWAVVVTPALFWVRVRDEEEFLARIFAEEWEGYCARTKRFVPGVF
ncbi:hypothetical protein BJY04DRAFT_98321 [Aspergillus karnatakaensis]|uniref:methyltransferase family protein n=1 Tax=Aspergillus karnatakaensis TaxID=1810916 RepID=UPI003CCD261C